MRLDGYFCDYNQLSCQYLTMLLSQYAPNEWLNYTILFISFYNLSITFVQAHERIQ